jgi:GT2 family glycosyltransferase
MQIDVCVLTAGGRWDLLELCLGNIRNEIECTTEHSFKLYLYDNGSDNVQEFRRLSEVPWITKAKRGSKNLGFPYGANHAIRMGTSMYVLFVTDDVLLQPGFLRSAISKMIESPDIGVQGFKLVFPHNSKDPQRPAGKVQHVGHAFTLRGECTHPLVGWSADHPKCCVNRELQSVTGAVMMFRRDVFSRVGGFDEVFGRGTYEDCDICLKIRSAKYKVWLNASAVAEHYTGATAEKLQLPFPMGQNRQIFDERWTRKGAVQWDSWTWY